MISSRRFAAGIVTDHDGADADIIADLAGLPQPSWVAMNPHTHAPDTSSTRSTALYASPMQDTAHQ
ncbi:hypothetical protein [Rothia sp. ZJ932]|uniref:hypothetical protein n=1 Tax=Rothia sp. ZJ932 TaxID=2810516 RepID=UPI0019678901|nr:hypothetical protein [Rothia sp. ZJ932]QRZ60970.1 hypothetical protein JR346_06800 [Rothia sp. ZJ932]